MAFANRRDVHHEWAVEVARQAQEPFLTCEAVLAETAFHLENSAYVLSLIEAGLAKPVFDLSQHQVRLRMLAQRYADRKPDLADLCLIRLSELHPKCPVITVDVEDFRAYRRNRNELIPLVTPA